MSIIKTIESRQFSSMTGRIGTTNAPTNREARPATLFKVTQMQILLYMNGKNEVENNKTNNQTQYARVVQRKSNAFKKHKTQTR